MPLIRFLSRLAFICNLFFIPVFILHFKDFITHPVLNSIFLILGYLLAIVLNPLINLTYLLLLLLKRNVFANIPKWLVITNFIFLLLQILYILLLNDTFHH